MTLETCRGT